MAWKPIKNPNNNDMKQWEYDDSPTDPGNNPKLIFKKNSFKKMVAGRTTITSKGKTINAFYRLRKKVI